MLTSMYLGIEHRCKWKWRIVLLMITVIMLLQGCSSSTNITRPYGIQMGMTFDQIDKALQNNGFVFAKRNQYDDNPIEIITYKDKTVFGYSAQVSLRRNYYYGDNPPITSIELLFLYSDPTGSLNNPSAMYNSIKNELNSMYGRPNDGERQWTSDKDQIYSDNMSLSAYTISIGYMVFPRKSGSKTSLENYVFVQYTFKYT